MQNRILTFNKVIILLFFCCPGFVLAQQAQTDLSEVNISVAGKTGTPLIIEGKVLDSDGNPIEGANLWIYHTDSDGFYAKDESGNDRGWRQADYSARLKSGTDGMFKIETMRPAGYPDSINPAHLHLRITAPGYPELEYTAYFEGGKRITNEIEALVEKFGTMFLLPVETAANGSKTVVWHITLLEKSPY